MNYVGKILVIKESEDPDLIPGYYVIISQRYIGEYNHIGLQTDRSWAHYGSFLYPETDDKICFKSGVLSWFPKN